MAPIGAFVGAATLDLHYLLADLPEPGTKGPAERFGVYAGGPATNAAATFAHLGGTAHLFTEMGSHPLTGAIVSDLTAHRVQVTDLLAGAPGTPMVSAVVTTASGERTVVASHYPDTGTAPSLTGGLPEGTGVLLIDGFLHHAALDAAGRAGELGTPVVLDAGSWKEGMADLLPLVDVAICSAEFRVPDTDDPIDALEAAGIEHIAVTAGPGPIRYRNAGTDGEVPVEQVDVVDTLGAGDVLHGAFAFHLAAGSSFEEALAQASRVATRSVTSFGTRAWMD